MNRGTFNNRSLYPSHIKVFQTNYNKLLVFQVISYLIGIRYRELLRITGFNNGTLTYHLETLEKNNIIKTLRVKHGNITRYYPHWVSPESAVTIGYLRTIPARQIMLLLHHEGVTSFSKIVSHINKSPSTTSWYLKKLIASEIVIRIKGKKNLGFSLKSPDLVTKYATRKTNFFLNHPKDGFKRP